MTAQQNAWNEEQWNKANEYNSPASQVERLRDAGLNPLYYGLDGSSTNALESAQPLGYEKATMSAADNPLTAGLQGLMAMKTLQKDIELKNAQIDKLGAEKSSIELDNDFKDKTMEARTEAIELGNNLTKENIDKIGKEKNQIEENIKKLRAETDNEVLKGALIEAQTNVAKMQEKELADLRSKLAELQMDNSALDAESYINACIAELEKIVNLADDEINEGLYERITKKIVVYPLNIIEIHLSFMTIPIRLQFSTSGRCEAYKVEFTILKQEEFDELMKHAPRNELPSKTE